MKQKTLWIICGIPSSGKTIFIQKYFKNHSNCKIISRDKIRFSFLKKGDKYFDREDLVFAKFGEKIKRALITYDDVIADATHLNEQLRTELLDFLGENFLKDIVINCIYMDTSLNTALRRNLTRTGWDYTYEQAIKDMWLITTCPNYNEKYKYDKIYIVNENGGISLV